MRRVNRSAAHRGRKILLRLYLFSTFFPDRATARESQPRHPRVARPFLVPPSSFSLSAYLPAVTILRAANASAFPYPPSLRLYLEMWHSTGLPRCLRWCGIRAGLPLRARPGGGCIGEMMRRLAGSSQKPPPSRLLTLLHLLHAGPLPLPPLSSPSRSFRIPLPLYPARARASAGGDSRTLALAPSRARLFRSSAPPFSRALGRRRSPRGGIQPPPPHRRRTTTAAAPPPHTTEQPSRLPRPSTTSD